MTADNGQARKTIRLWDSPTRIFHWLLVILVTVSYFSAEEGEMEIHEISGITVLVLVIFRFIWGFVGSSSARFSHFVRGPRAVIDYIRALLRRDPPHTAGHNPLGGWVVVAFLLMLLVQATLGLFSKDDIFYEGPLTYMITDDTSDTISGIHHELFEFILILIGIHVAAVIGYWLVFKENLIKAMITGKKRVEADATGQSLSFRSPFLAAVITAIVAGIVLLIVQ
jgi:cytochrome b